jgi:hypothetical protein
MKEAEIASLEEAVELLPGSCLLSSGPKTREKR